MTASTQIAPTANVVDSKPGRANMQLHGTTILSHPVYADGSLILIGDRIRSHNKIDGAYYEGTISGVSSTSLFCLPMCDLTLVEGVCEDLYLVERAPRTQVHQFTRLQAAKVKLAKGEPLNADERAALLEATSRHNL